MSHFLPSGRFSVGANYWASHAGIAMWRDWRPEIIDRDFALLAAEGLQVLRVFPLWSDFQPIQLQRGYIGRPMEYRHGETALPDNVAVQDGVSAEMLARFSILADRASSHGLDLVVGLVTGWMSGRLFVPRALEGLNPITDPLSQMWQIRFVRTFVERFKAHPAIKAWDLGNECNCLGAATREQAWLWSAALTHSIRSADPSRAVISGMHSLGADPASPWSIRDQGEITDILTTHPYPAFTPHAQLEPLDSMRPLLHATAETCLYADLGGRPAFVEEFGNLGPMFCGGAETASLMRASLASLWAHDCRGALWWCAHDQLALDYAPYDWLAVERELGLVRTDGTPKPVLREFGAFRRELESLPFSELPRRRIDAVCVLTPGQDNWGVAYSTFVLAKQAGLDVRFHYADRALPDAELYFVPSLHGYGPLSRQREDELWARVRAGATAYVSLADGLLAHFAEATGVEVLTRSERKGSCAMELPGGGRLTMSAPLLYRFAVRTAEVLAADAHGPVFFKNKLGAGEVFTLVAPVEESLLKEPQLFAGDECPPFWHLYREIAARALAQRRVHKGNPWLGVTEHAFPGGGLCAVVVNYSPREQADVLTLAEGLAVDGTAPVSEHKYTIRLAAHGHAIWRISTRF